MAAYMYHLHILHKTQTDLWPLGRELNFEFRSIFGPGAVIGRVSAAYKLQNAVS